MNSLCWLGEGLAVIDVPKQFGNIILYAVMTVLAGCTVTSLVKIGMGFKNWIRGEDAFAEIKSGFLIAVIPWAVQSAFNGVGLFKNLGIDFPPTEPLIGKEVQDLLQYALWITIGLFLAIAMYLGIEGAQKMSRGEEGMRMSFGVPTLTQFQLRDRGRILASRARAMQ
ncbi:hypothetical protein DB347_17165 [Opitutaceae bacterium EW11]|nr:hypothetical protein DB347_17165 [Opitutaceae bacterium EW11]